MKQVSLGYSIAALALALGKEVLAECHKSCSVVGNFGEAPRELLIMWRHMY